MNQTLDQVRQSILHVLNEWAKAGHLWDEHICLLRLTQHSRSDRQGYINRTTTTGLGSDLQRRQMKHLAPLV
jgi:hypothetical protein